MRFGRLACSVMIAVIGAAAVDAALASIEGAAPSARGWVFLVGLASPWSLAAGAFVASASHGASRIRARFSPRASSPGASAESGAPVESSRAEPLDGGTRNGALLASLLLGAALAALCAVVVTTGLVRSIHTPSFAAIAATTATLVLLVVGLAAAAALFPLVDRLFVRLGTTAWIARMLRPRGVLALFVMLGLLSVGAWLSRRPAVLDTVPTPSLLATVAGATLGIVVALRFPSRRSVERAGAALLVGTSILCTAIAAVAPGDWSIERAQTARSHGISRVLLALDDRVGDVDGDGVSSLFGGRDCAPFDGTRGPFAPEVPNNGADEDCSGLDADATLLPLDRARGRRSPTLVRALPTRRPHVILVSTDALSFTHTGIGGYERPTTPHLDAWARRATIFRRAYSTASATANAVPALHTGRLALSTPGLLPPRNQARSGGRTATTLADLARREGYRSVAIPGAAFFDLKEWPELGGRFDRVETDQLVEAPRGVNDKVYAGPGITERALAEIERAGGQPLFLWLHYFDHHPVYGSPPGGARFGHSNEMDRYDSELAFADEQWGRLFDGIESKLGAEAYILIFTSDHGEAFDADHPSGHHDQGLLDAEVHVPFVVQTAWQRGVEVSGLVSHLDIMATLDDWLGGDELPDLDGESLLPVLVDGSPPRKTITMSVLWEPRGGPVGAPPLRASAIRTDEWLVVEDREKGTFALFDQAADPFGHHDLATRHPQILEWGRWAIASEIERVSR